MGAMNGPIASGIATADALPVMTPLTMTIVTMMVPRDAEAYATVAGANPTAMTPQTPATPTIARMVPRDAGAYATVAGANPPRARTLQTPATPIARIDADAYLAN